MQNVIIRISAKIILGRQGACITNMAVKASRNKAGKVELESNVVLSSRQKSQL